MSQDAGAQVNVLELPKVGIEVRDGVLYKKTARGAIVVMLPLSTISDARLVRKIDPISVVVAPVAATLAIVAKVSISSTGWGWTAFAVLLGLSMFLMINPKKPLLVLFTDGGQVEYDLSRHFAEAEGFALSLKAMVSQTTISNPVTHADTHRDAEDPK